ncbi:hypothetical protein AGDE_17106 [Angomonas deanei]|nr:hypothetical protein AGDE_17106 [Angomonas deanei]|eukprot:EPY15463.1 hypothetical protein AGDE_17106 [Angomonas deanei]
MTEFRRQNNRFTTLGDSIAALTSAVVIDLSDNRDLAGGAVLGDSAIPYARELHLDNTALTVHVSKQFWANTRLVNFTAANVGSVVFHDVDEGAALPNELPASLEYLDLTNAGLTGTLPEALGTASNNLKSLKLGGNNFTGCIADAYRNHDALRRAAEQLVKDQGLQYCSPGGAAAEKGDNSWREWKGPLVGGLVGGVLLIIVVGVLIWRYCFGCGCWCNCCGFKRYVFSRDWRTRHWNIRKKMIKCCARLLCCKMDEVATPLASFKAFMLPDKPRGFVETLPSSAESQRSFSSVSDTSECSATSTDKPDEVAVPMENPTVEGGYVLPEALQQEAPTQPQDTDKPDEVAVPMENPTVEGGYVLPEALQQEVPTQPQDTDKPDEVAVPMENPTVEGGYVLPEALQQEAPTQPQEMEAVNVYEYYDEYCRAMSTVKEPTTNTEQRRLSESATPKNCNDNPASVSSDIIRSDAAENPWTPFKMLEKDAGFSWRSVQRLALPIVGLPDIQKDTTPTTSWNTNDATMSSADANGKLTITGMRQYSFLRDITRLASNSDKTPTQTPPPSDYDPFSVYGSCGSNQENPTSNNSITKNLPYKDDQPYIVGYIDEKGEHRESRLLRGSDASNQLYLCFGGDLVHCASGLWTSPCKEQWAVSFFRKKESGAKKRTPGPTPSGTATLPVSGGNAHSSNEVPPPATNASPSNDGSQQNTRDTAPEGVLYKGTFSHLLVNGSVKIDMCGTPPAVERALVPVRKEQVKQGERDYEEALALPREVVEKAREYNLRKVEYVASPVWGADPGPGNNEEDKNDAKPSPPSNPKNDPQYVFPDTPERRPK